MSSVDYFFLYVVYRQCDRMSRCRNTEVIELWPQLRACCCSPEKTWQLTSTWDKKKHNMKIKHDIKHVCVVQEENRQYMFLFLYICDFNKLWFVVEQTVKPCVSCFGSLVQGEFSLRTGRKRKMWNSKKQWEQIRKQEIGQWTRVLLDQKDYSYRNNRFQTFSEIMIEQIPHQLKSTISNIICSLSSGISHFSFSATRQKLVYCTLQWSEL